MCDHLWDQGDPISYVHTCVFCGKEATRKQIYEGREDEPLDLDPLKFWELQRMVSECIRRYDHE